MTSPTTQRVGRKATRDLIVLTIVGILAALGVDALEAIGPTGTDHIDVDATVILALTALAPGSLAAYRGARDARLLERFGVAPSPEVTPPPPPPRTPPRDPDAGEFDDWSWRALYVPTGGRAGKGYVQALPLDGPITGRMGERGHPYPDLPPGHLGVDIGAAAGTHIKNPAPRARVVFRATEHDRNWPEMAAAFGNCVILEHGEYRSLYAHMLAAPRVAVGDLLEAGDIIGQVGATGRTEGAHLHWAMAPRENEYVSSRHEAGLLDPLDFFHRAT